MKRNKQSLFGTKEWADCNKNIQRGCSHDCLYCYAKEMAIRFERATPKNWNKEIVNMDALTCNFKKSARSVMFPSSHDITPYNLEESLIFIENLVKAYAKVLIVTKSHLECIEAICNKFTDYKSKIVFRLSVGSSSSETLKFWEPGAPSFEERLESLKYAFKQGYATSVSCEPMLDVNIDDLIKRTCPFVTESLWIGKMNKARARLKINGAWSCEVERRLNELDNAYTDEKLKLLCNQYQDHSLIKWKESISRIIAHNQNNTKTIFKNGAKE